MQRSDVPLVSIRIISYNQKRFIRECIDSVLAQDYENIEIVVSDDGSTDGTADIIKGYAKEYPDKFKVALSKVNQGITKNVNIGLKLCRGKYIAGLGGDDMLLPGKISAQVAWMEEDANRVLCGHQVEVFYDDGSASHNLSSQLCTGSGPKWLIENGVPYGATAMMVRAKSVPEKGFDARLVSVSDQLFWIDCLKGGGVFGYVEGTYARYRKHDSNITANVEHCIVDVQKMFDILEEEYPEFHKSIKVGRRNQIDARRAKIYFNRGFYLRGFFLLLMVYAFSPKRLYAMLSFRIRKVRGY